MNKNRKLDVFVIMLFIVEILIVKHFYQTEDLFHFRSLFWGFHELITLIFLGISYILLHEDIGYYDVFLILFPLIGISLLLLERIFQKWKVSNAVIDELLSSDEQEEKKEQKFVPEEFEIMSYYDLLSSDNIDEKKKFLFSFQTKEIDLKIKILKKALLDKNIDVIHYAATELNKIETELQNKISELEKKDDKEELYRTYKTYINSGLLYDSILEFYLRKAAELLGSLDKNTIDKGKELLCLYKLGNEIVEYEDILKKRIKKKEEKKDIQDYCYFLYQENHFADLLKILKKYKSKNIEIPYCFKQYVKE